MSVTTRSFGRTGRGEEATLYRIENAHGLAAEITDFGANLVSLLVPDRNGHVDDIVLGFDDVSGYTFNPSFFGSTIGRSANRIADARFTLNGVTYELEKNDGVNNLHSHFDDCFNKKLFKAEYDPDGCAVRFSVFSPDGDQGFPGNVTFAVTYSLSNEGGLVLDYEAVTDADTIMNVTNHSYFNLSGHASGSAMDHRLMLNAAHYTPTFPGSIPTGEIAEVKGTPFDFTQFRRIGDRIDESCEQLALAGGYDHNFVIDAAGSADSSAMRQIAILADEQSGRMMQVYSDLPGVQFYAGNFIATQAGKGGVTYAKRCGVCLETQYFPNAINTSGWAKPVLKPGETFRSTTEYRFSVE